MAVSSYPQKKRPAIHIPAAHDGVKELPCRRESVPVQLDPYTLVSALDFQDPQGKSMITAIKTKISSGYLTPGPTPAHWSPLPTFPFKPKPEWPRPWTTPQFSTLSNVCSLTFCSGSRVSKRIGTPIAHGTAMEVEGSSLARCTRTAFWFCLEISLLGLSQRRNTMLEIFDR